MYVFIGTLNLSIGLICILLFLLGESDAPWLHKCLINMLIGTMIITDVLLLGNRAKHNYHN